ncbi:cytochrome P450 3A5 [Thozetella sp. PMI_491]|nr:cytochrome P450 3A5 [Thozetella sp. PMI_491]
MDISTCLCLSLVEILALRALGEAGYRTALQPNPSLGTFLGLATVQYTLIKLYRIFIYPFWISPLRHLPTPEGAQFAIGHFGRQLMAPSPIELYVKWAKQFPDTPLIRHLGPLNKVVVLINGIEAHREVFQTNCYSFEKPAFFHRFISEIAGTGLLFSEGHEHMRQKKIVTRVFTTPYVRRTLPVFQENASLLTRYIDKACLQRGKGVIELQTMYSKAAMDIIGKTALGVDLENLVSPVLKMDFLQCYHRMFESSPTSMAIAILNSYIPIRRLLPFVKANTNYADASGEVKRMLRQCAQDRALEMKDAEKGESSRCLLTYMLETNELTDDEIIGHLLNSLSAGHETISGAMSWGTLMLARNPDIQDKLRAEVQDLLSQKPVPEYSDIESMKYMQNFIREILRFFSPAVASHREAVRDVTICGQYIPKGTHVVFCPETTNHSTAIWGPTADDFDPDRWNNLTGDAGTPYSVMSFGNGPRLCIGKTYALVEMKVLFIEVISKFRFSLTPELIALNGKLPKVKNPGVTLRAEGGIRLMTERL